MDNEMPVAYECEFRMARKDHKCCECQGSILSGEQYYNHHGVWDGRGETFKVCHECESLRTEMNADINNWDEKIHFTGLAEHVVEMGIIKYLKKLLEIKEKRKGPITKYMVETFDAIINND